MLGLDISLPVYSIWSQ